MNPSMALLVVLIGQAQPAPEAREILEARLDFMKRSVGAHTVHPADNVELTYRLQPDPVLRFTNTVGTVKDGAIFLWLGEADRPEAAVQIFWHRLNGIWFQEFASLSTAPISAGRAWSATQPGVEFKPIPGAPRPAETAEQRLRQVRALTDEFTVEDNFEQKSWQKLRLLTRPFARYGKPGARVTDGALYAFVLTTDPEAFLMIEARAGKDGPEWQYAFAPASIYPLRASLKGREVWSVPYREAWTDPHAPYYVWGFHREP